MCTDPQKEAYFNYEMRNLRKNLKFSLYRFLVYSGFGLDRFLVYSGFGKMMANNDNINTVKPV
jgi:hypothetical protein